MTRIQITLACGAYDRTMPLIDGSVQAEGIRLNYLKLDAGQAFWRMLHATEFDASEMSMSALISLIANGDRRFVAIPAFTSRAFRHSSIFVRADSALRRPQDLRGKRVGVPQYAMSAALWIRAFLEHDFAVAPHDMEWVQSGLDRPGYPERIPLRLPASVRLTPRVDRSLSELLILGEIDAILGGNWPAPARQGDSRVRHLFADYREVEKEYFTRTRFFPIMHCIVIRRDVYEANRWIAHELYKAFVRAKDAAYVDMGDPGVLKYMLPWLATDFRETRDLMGADPWRYGIKASRHELEAMTAYSFEQGLSARRVDVDEIFAPELADDFPGAAVS